MDVLLRREGKKKDAGKGWRCIRRRVKEDSRREERRETLRPCMGVQTLGI